MYMKDPSLAWLSSIVEYCTRPGGSSLYRDLYGLKPGVPFHKVSSWEGWRALPFITKEILLREPIWKRAFVAQAEGDTIYATSGTTGSPPLFTPRNEGARGTSYRTHFHDFKKPLLASFLPHHRNEAFMNSISSKAQVIALDPGNIKASVHLAKSAGVESIAVQSYLIHAVAQELSRVGIAQSIKYVETGGEVSTKAFIGFLRGTFPNATIVSQYGASEVEGSTIAIVCRPLEEKNLPEAFHANENIYIELIDPETLEVIEKPEAGVEGELVITSYIGEGAAFPMIRYRIGDRARVVEGACKEHGAWSFTVLGRMELDSIKISGGVLRADEVERVLRLFDEQVSDEFVLHCIEKTTPKGPLIQVVLYVVLRGTTLPLEALAKKIEAELHVGPAITYAQGVSKGLYLPLLCRPLSPNTEHKKRVRMKRISEGEAAV